MRILRYIRDRIHACIVNKRYITAREFDEIRRGN